MAALVARLTFVTLQAVALISRLSFVTELSVSGRSDSLLEFLNLQPDLLFGFLFHLLTLSFFWFNRQNHCGATSLQS